MQAYASGLGTRTRFQLLRLKPRLVIAAISQISNRISSWCYFYSLSLGVSPSVGYQRRLRTTSRSIPDFTTSRSSKLRVEAGHVRRRRRTITSIACRQQKVGLESMLYIDPTGPVQSPTQSSLNIVFENSKPQLQIRTYSTQSIIAESLVLFLTPHRTHSDLR